MYSPNYKNRFSNDYISEKSSTYYHNISSDSVPFRSSYDNTPSSYLFGTPRYRDLNPYKSNADTYSEYIESLRNYDKTNKLSRSDADKNRSFNYSLDYLDDYIPQHGNKYFVDSYKSYISPQYRVYGSPPLSPNRKKVHYNSQLSMNSSGRSDSRSPSSRSMSPNVIYNKCPIHPYLRQPLILHERVVAPFGHLHGPNTSMRSNVSTSSDLNGRKPQFVAVTRLEDAQAIRAAEFHPNGQLYAIGSNSKTLRICGYPKHHELRTLREDHVPHQPTVLSKRLKHHKGSIYCLAWNTTGDLLATGSNDKTIKMMRFNCDNCELEGGEAELTMHDGTIRDMCFMEDLTNRSSLLISGGAGDCKIYVTDCDTATPFQALSGHSGHILSLYTWGGAMFVSGSQDRTIRFWDLRTSGCVNLITAPPASGSGPGSPVAAVCVDPSGKLLVSGHEDSNCMLYDIRGGRIIQTFQPHMSDIRTIRFSNKAYYLLTGGYDNKVVLTDLQGDLTQPLPSVVVAEHSDKVIQGRWHPNDFTFLTTSADKTATLWALPN